MLARIEDAFRRRERSEESVRRFVADAGHELRTPLTSVRGFAELYRRGGLDDPADLARAMQRIESEAQRMGALVDDMLVLARLDQHPTLTVASVDLLVVAADSVHDAAVWAPDRQVRLTGLDGDEPRDGGVLVLGDDARLRQVLANLLGNVVQHTPAGTPVEIAVGVVAGPAGAPLGVVEVRDHGPGIDPEHAARVFERFYRIDAARGRDSGGAGLGMAIVAAIVEAHGGSVGLAQTPGGGTTVRVALPVQMSGSSNAPSE
jgi:two-component system OmpR family sensor kinase